MAEFPFICYVVQSFHVPTGKLLGLYHRVHWGEHCDRHYGSVSESFEGGTERTGLKPFCRTVCVLPHFSKFL